LHYQDIAMKETLLIIETILVHGQLAINHIDADQYLCIV